MTVVVVPCRNGAKTVSRVITESYQHVDLVVVVDNASTDETARTASLAGAIVISCGVRGAGAATRAGIEAALAYGGDVVVTLDADGQHDALEISKVLNPVVGGAADVVIGSRFLGTPIIAPRYRTVGIKVINLAYNVGHTPISDSQSGFRAFTKRVADACVMVERGFAFSTEFLIKARKSGFRIMEVPVRCIYHKNGRDHSLNPIVHGLSVVVKTIVWRIRERN